MLLGIFSETIEGRRRASMNRLVREIAADVSGEADGRFVALLAIFVEGFHHNPVKIAAQVLPKLPLVHSMLLRKRGKRWTLQGADARAGFWRLLLPNNSLH